MFFRTNDEKPLAEEPKARGAMTSKALTVAAAPSQDASRYGYRLLEVISKTSR